MNFDSIKQSIMANGSNKAKQNAQMADLQNLIKKANQTLACGPTCQKLQKTEDLKQKYIAAQTNVISAPDQLKQAQKNFYLYSQGVSGYDNVIESDLTNKAEKIAELMQFEFDENVKKAETLTDNYETLDSQHEYMKDLKKKYIEENAKLALEIKDIFTDIVTNDRKTYYQDQNMTREYGWYNLYSVIYIFFMFVFLICIFLADSIYSFKIKIGVFILLAIYPWIIIPILIKILGLFQHIVRLLPKNIYKDL
jgi:hypothetical protein